MPSSLTNIFINLAILGFLACWAQYTGILPIFTMLYRKAQAATLEQLLTFRKKAHKHDIITPTPTTVDSDSASVSSTSSTSSTSTTSTTSTEPSYNPSRDPANRISDAERATLEALAILIPKLSRKDKSNLRRRNRWLDMTARKYGRKAYWVGTYDQLCVAAEFVPQLTMTEAEFERSQAFWNKHFAEEQAKREAKSRKFAFKSLVDRWHSNW
ncbi:uncharacterized protein EHS24_005353 [Apiotrichum porosum]|uniref:Uncharacterized protein n=1 Tax=Apiotrichum porosum TaxID=105984 RepID=A0A427XD42_9TREE|nr:uncharacterized protein EHS24_005353 [Apiotrichum porosum]RSH76775.1 hypothetical protein EHS24_005353 [Apiotrichum porosum]